MDKSTYLYRHHKTMFRPRCDTKLHRFPGLSVTSATEMPSEIASTRYQNGYKKNPVFVKKLKISCRLDHTISFKFHQHMAHAGVI